MRVLLINPERLIHPPFGLLYVGTVLRSEGHDVSLTEISFGLDWGQYYGLVCNEIENFKPEMIGITCMSMQAQISKALVKNIKRDFKDVTVIVGGIHPTVDSNDMLSCGADIVIRGEGERTVLEIVDYRNGKVEIESIKGISFRNNDNFINNPDRELIKNLDELPPLSYDLLRSSRLKKRSYAIRGFWLRCAWVMTARGCPGNCIFCATKTMHGRVVREFGMERILDEVERLKKAYDIEGLWLVDDTFSLKERRVIEFCEGLKKRKIKIVWACQTRVDTFTERMAKAMKCAGCVQVDFGVESGSQRILDYIKKGTRCEDTKRSFEIAKKHGLRALATVMVGVPTEKMEDIQMTENLLNEIKPNFVAPFFITPYPGTELHTMAQEKGWIDISKDINWQSTEEPLMAVEMPLGEIKKAYDKLLSYNRFAIIEYLLQPFFLLDLFKSFIKHPKYMFKIIKDTVKGRKKDAMNLFLYIFRKEMLGDT